jgi:hypothetical protein
MRSGNGAVARGQGYYWSRELKLRELESELGILAIASGSAMAVRRSVFRPLPPDVGEDCIIPLDVALQGLKVVHASAALALDSMEFDPAGEFKDRVRMTLRNWVGTWRREALLNPLRYPGYAFALWSHKVLRWLSPFFFLVAILCSIRFIDHPVLWVIPFCTALFLAAGALGGIVQMVGLELPLIGTVFSFFLANVGFFVGIIRALAGHSIVAYKKNHQQTELL